MAQDLNKIVVSGRLGKEPETRYTPAGLAITSFSLANGTYKKDEGDNNTLTTWYRCSILGKRAETAIKLLDKGSYVTIEGVHSIRKFTDKDGNERESNEINVNDFFLPPRVRSDSDATDTATPTKAPTRQPATRNVPQATGGSNNDEDLPFAPNRY